MKRERGFKKNLLIQGIAACALFLNAAHAQENKEVVLEKIVVTPYRGESQSNNTSSSVTVISKQDIEDSNAKTVVDALRNVPGLSVRDFWGNAAKASVDLRGFGEQGGMNALVLVDGRRVNEVDLSAVDWTQVPLNQVERIEIIRGGDSVLYGDNAVSGVINIITKKGQGDLRVNAETHYGSYDYNLEKIAVSGSRQRLSYWFNLSREGTHGYRNNSFFKTRDFATKLTYDITDDFLARFQSGLHRASYGMPGALFQSHIDSYNRRYSRFGDDSANDEDYYFVLGGETGLGDMGKIDLDVSFRRRHVSTDFIGANAGWNPQLFSRIDTTGFTPKYRLETKSLKFNNMFLTGVDVYKYDYSADTYNTADVLQDFSDINKLSIGGYIYDELNLFMNLYISGGFRYEAQKYSFDYHDNAGFYPDIDSNISPNEKAFNAGLNYKLADESSVFFNIKQNFRFPATDEFFTWGSLNTNLKPQLSKSYEAGLRYRINKKHKLELSLYRMNIKDELFYNPSGGPFGFGANENYDKTMHQGIEFSLDSKCSEDIGVFGNFTLTDAVFKSGDYNNKFVPMVAKYKGNLGMRLNVWKNFKLNLTGNYVDKRFAINDQANIRSRLNGYFTCDANLRYEVNNFLVQFGVNNIFNKLYSEYGVFSTTSNEVGYYPSPGRNFLVKFEYNF